MTYEEAIATIPCVKYRHYNGNEYTVMGIAINSETLEPMVVYRELKGEQRIWARPAEMWNQTVNGVPRFSRI